MPEAVLSGATAEVNWRLDMQGGSMQGGKGAHYGVLDICPIESRLTGP